MDKTEEKVELKPAVEPVKKAVEKKAAPKVETDDEKKAREKEENRQRKLAVGFSKNALETQLKLAVKGSFFEKCLLEEKKRRENK